MIFIPEEVRDDWTQWGFEGPRHPCFLCAEAVGEGQVAVWMGSGGNITVLDDGSTMSEVLKRLEGAKTTALYVFLHPQCIPSFARRLLQDWEQVYRV